MLTTAAIATQNSYNWLVNIHMSCTEKYSRRNMQKKLSDGYYWLHRYYGEREYVADDEGISYNDSGRHYHINYCAIAHGK